MGYKVMQRIARLWRGGRAKCFVTRIIGLLQYFTKLHSSFEALGSHLKAESNSGLFVPVSKQQVLETVEMPTRKFPVCIKDNF